MFSFLQSTEFLVIIFTIAAILIAFIVKPSGRGQAETSFAKGELYPDSNPTPRLEFRYTPHGELEISRCGLNDITTADSIALAITRIGFDIQIEERIVRSDHSSGFPAQRAIFIIPDLAEERYHISYNSPAFSTFLALTIPLRPGLSTTRPFPH